MTLRAASPETSTLGVQHFKEAVLWLPQPLVKSPQTNLQKKNNNSTKVEIVSTYFLGTEYYSLLLDPTLGNVALLQYINGTEQGVSLNDVFRITFHSNERGAADIHGLVPKDSQAGSILLPAQQQLPNIFAFEGPVFNVKILTFSDTEIYSDQGLALLCQNLKVH